MEKLKYPLKVKVRLKVNRARKEALNKQDQIYIDTIDLKNGLSESEAKARLKQAKANKQKIRKASTRIK